jgi:ParB-like chromosome segregation protein Spo0J
MVSKKKTIVTDAAPALPSPVDPIMDDLKAQLEASAGDPIEVRVARYNALVAMAATHVNLPHPSLSPQLVPVERVQGNDYNPNKVAPPEMRLLKLSISKDGLTMPIVVCDDYEGDKLIVVDGFHRTTVVQHSPEIRDSLEGYMPVVKLNKAIEDRISSTVRHNMARGSHQVELTAKLVTALKNHNWTNARIGLELGMDPDEVLRLKQITGLAEAFADKEFSRAWE